MTNDPNFWSNCLLAVAIIGSAIIASVITSYAYNRHKWKKEWAKFIRNKVQIEAILALMDGLLKLQEKFPKEDNDNNGN